MQASRKPPKEIVMMEDHDKAYHAWEKSGVRKKVLVHVDAHIDFGWVPDVDIDELKDIHEDAFLNPFTKSRKKMMHIGNYIYLAIRDGMVSKFYWVVPDESWKSRRGRRFIKRQLRGLMSTKRCADRKIASSKDSFRCRILDTEIIVSALDGLEEIREPALLDLDVDFLVTGRIWDDLDARRMPWIFPDELAERLNPKLGEIEVLTISYSVEGGFTPLRFKYLGDHLKMLFEGKLPEHKAAAMGSKRMALLHEKHGRTRDAMAYFEKALQEDPSDQSAYFNLFRLNIDSRDGDPAKAGWCYGRAVDIDRTYYTAFNNYGIFYLSRGNLKKAGEEFKKFLRLDGKNADALAGLGHIELRRKRYREADRLFNMSLDVLAGSREARYGKALAAFKSSSHNIAEEIFLGLKTEDPDNPETHWWLGRIAEGKGDIPAAIENYKNAVMSGGEGPMVHLRLFRLYALKGMRFRALEEIGRFFHAARRWA